MRILLLCNALHAAKSVVRNTEMMIDADGNMEVTDYASDLDHRLKAVARAHVNSTDVVEMTTREGKFCDEFNKLGSTVISVVIKAKRVEGLLQAWYQLTPGCIFVKDKNDPPSEDLDTFQLLLRFEAIQTDNFGRPLRPVKLDEDEEPGDLVTEVMNRQMFRQRIEKQGGNAHPLIKRFKKLSRQGNFEFEIQEGDERAPIFDYLMVPSEHNDFELREEHKDWWLEWCADQFPFSFTQAADGTFTEFILFRRSLCDVYHYEDPAFSFADILAFKRNDKSRDLEALEPLQELEDAAPSNNFRSCIREDHTFAPVGFKPLPNRNAPVVHLSADGRRKLESQLPPGGIPVLFDDDGFYYTEIDASGLVEEE